MKPTFPLQNNPALTLSHCARKYLLACADPWSPHAEGACVPKASRPSQKLTLFNRFQITIGGQTNANSSVGMIYVMPALANDAPVVYYLDNSVGLNRVPTTSLEVQQLLPFAKPVFLNTPYSTTQLSEVSSTTPPAVSGRIVSAGLSVQYFGSELYKGGTITSYVSPNHDNLVGYAPTSISNAREASINKILDQKTWLPIAGIEENEFEFPNTTSVDSLGNTFITPSIYPFSNGSVLSNYKPISTQPGMTNNSLQGRTNVELAYNVSVTSIAVTISTRNATIASTGTLFLLVPGSVGFPTIQSTGYTAVSIVGNVATFTVAFTPSSTVPANSLASTGFPGQDAAPSPTPGGAPMMVILQPANASSSNANIYQVEYVSHVEYVGPLTSTALTPTHSDYVGFQKVNTVVQRLPAARVSQPNASLQKLAIDTLKDVVREMAPVALEGIGKMAKSYLRGNAGELAGTLAILP